MKENVTKAVDHKPTDSKTCTEFRDDHYLRIGDILQIPLILMHAQTNKKLLLRKKGSDPLNLPMTPKFSNKESSMTPKNYGLAETLSLTQLCTTQYYHLSRLNGPVPVFSPIYYCNSTMFISTMAKSIKLITRHEKLVLLINFSVFYNA